MGAFLGKLIGWILIPIKFLIFQLLYSLFIRGPLWLLNTESRALDFVSGSYTDKLLFDTTLHNGQPQLNFFSGNSPLHTFYMAMIGIAGTLLALFFGLSIISSLRKGGKGPLKKVTALAMNSVLIFVIPTIFLTALSLSGTLMNLVNGNQSYYLSASDINTFKSSTLTKINDLETTNYNKGIVFNKKYINKLDNEKYWKGTYDPNTKQWTWIKNANKSVEDIYSSLLTENDNYQITENIKGIASISESAYNAMNKLIVEYNSTTATINSKLSNKLQTAGEIINGLETKKKDEKEADSIKGLNNYLVDLQDAIKKWKESADELASYASAKPVTETSRHKSYQYFLDDFTSI